MAPEAETLTEYIPRVDADVQAAGRRAGEGYVPRFATWERALIALITGFITYGGATGNVWVAFPACVVMVAVVFALLATPVHKQRKEARVAGGGADKRAGIALAVAWLAILVIDGLVLFLVPERFTLTGGILTAFVAAGLIWGTIAYIDRPTAPPAGGRVAPTGNA